MNSWFLAAAILSLLTWCAHVFAGGPSTVGPLLRSKDIDPVAKYTSYYGWHLVSIVLFAMPIGFGLGAWRERSVELAVLMTCLAAAFALWSVVLIVWKFRQPWQLPQWVLFVPIACLGAIGWFVG